MFGERAVANERNTAANQHSSQSTQQPINTAAKHFADERIADGVRVLGLWQCGSEFDGRMAVLLNWQNRACVLPRGENAGTPRDQPRGGSLLPSTLVRSQVLPAR